VKITLLRLKENRFGGAERYLERLREELEKRGIEVKVCRSSLSNWVPDWIKLLHFNHFCCGKKRGEREIYFSLDRVICPDIYRAGDGVHKVYLKQEKKYCWWLNPRHWVYLSLEKKAFENAKRIIANSRMVKWEIVETYHISPKKIDIIYNGIPIPRRVDEKGEPELRKELGIGRKEKVILFVGSDFKRKGLKEALELLAKMNPDLREMWRFVVVGKGKNVWWYKWYAKRLGIRERVIFAGPQKRVERFYRMGDILILPTHYDPFSNVVLEGLVYKNVVFTTIFNGASEILPSNWVQKNLHDTSIIPNIEQLILTPSLLRKEQERARLIGIHYSISLNVTKTLKVIEALYPNFEPQPRKEFKNGTGSSQIIQNPT